MQFCAIKPIVEKNIKKRLMCCCVITPLLHQGGDSLPRFNLGGEGGLLGTLRFLAYEKHMLDKTKVSSLVKTHILSFMTPLLFPRFLRETLSISFKMLKKGREHKNKMCFSTIRKTFVLSSICQKCQGSE